jgi:enoyl-CoA hydratase/3-hydroxyacyl-CoA dehydrogenase
MEVKKEFKYLILEKEDCIYRILLNNPKLNLISLDLLEDLNDAIDLISSDKTARVVLVEGNNNVFSAGADLKNSKFNNTQDLVDFFRKGERVFRRLSDIPAITIAVMKGFAFGGGLELSIACDLRISDESTMLGLPEVTLGLIPGWGGTQRLPRLIGVSRAMGFIMTGERINAIEAYNMGLINKLHKEDVSKYALEFAKNLASSVSPISAMIAKRLVNKAAEVPMDVGLDMESLGGAALYGLSDFKEGINAFFEKRKPVFKGLP